MRAFHFKGGRRDNWFWIYNIATDTKDTISVAISAFINLVVTQSITTLMILVRRRFAGHMLLPCLPKMSDG
jgi:hypothetical protein